MHQTDPLDVEPTIALRAESHNRFATLAPMDLSDGEKDSVIQLALRALETTAQHQVFTDVESTKRYLQLRFAREPNELCACAYLDTHHRLIELAELFHGTIDGYSVHPRVVAQRALAVGASACIVAHNYPSGDPSPSAADIRITHRIREALGLLDIRLLDHIIVGREGAVSLAARGDL
ncbi:MAG: DNA repair protein [Chromatiaceae bacterium]|nr:DNA repair protein [Chromatiaceae bacterium]